MLIGDTIGSSTQDLEQRFLKCLSDQRFVCPPRHSSNHLHNGTTARKHLYRFEALLIPKTSTRQPLTVFLSHRKHVYIFYCLCPNNTAIVTLEQEQLSQASPTQQVCWWGLLLRVAGLTSLRQRLQLQSSWHLPGTYCALYSPHHCFKSPSLPFPPWGLERTDTCSVSKSKTYTLKCKYQTMVPLYSLKATKCLSSEEKIIRLQVGFFLFTMLVKNQNSVLCTALNFWRLPCSGSLYSPWTIPL